MVGTGLGTMAATDQGGGGGGLAPGGGTAWDSAIGLRWLAACGMSHSGISMGLLGPAYSEVNRIMLGFFPSAPP